MTNNKAFYISITMAAFFLIGGIALGRALNGETAWSFFKPPPRLAVVDMQALIAKSSQRLAKTASHKASGKASRVSSPQIRQAGEQLKEILENFATRRHLILLAKGAVMGGNIPDYTTEIMEEAFPDYTAALLTFIEKTTSRPSKNHQLESQASRGQWFKDPTLKDQGSRDQENQP